MSDNREPHAHQHLIPMRDVVGCRMFHFPARESTIAGDDTIRRAVRGLKQQDITRMSALHLVAEQTF